jgi:hypothetical protein
LVIVRFPAAHLVRGASLAIASLDSHLIRMSKSQWRGAAQLAPVPAAVSAATYRADPVSDGLS